MAKFIPIDKMKKLRESARNGDERAKEIISIQLGGKDDFSELLEQYFANPEPVRAEEPTQPALQGDNLGGGDDSNPRLLEFLSFNKIDSSNPEYKSFVEDFYKENPNEKPMLGGQAKQDGQCVLDPLIADEIEAISGYQEAMLKAISDDGLDETTKKGLIADLEEIKRDEIEHLEKLKRIKSSIEKKQEKAELPLQ